MNSQFSDDQSELNQDESEFEPIVDDSSEEEYLSEPVDDWGGGELEAAYLKALSALEASELEIPSPVTTGSGDSELDNSPELTEPSIEVRSADPRPEQQPPLSVDELRAPEVARPDATESQMKSDAPPPPEFRPIPRQIIEACLFVGGSPLTSSRLAGVLRGEFSSDYVDGEIDSLNRLYAAEGRPYEIRLGEGGYRLALRDEFERIRHKVYGLGPKEVRLSQEALEVLAVVAYYQPITQARIEELGKPGCGAVVRQLVRRELVAVTRDAARPKEVHYQTTPRFLSLFGIRNLDELPRPEQVSYK